MVNQAASHAFDPTCIRYFRAIVEHEVSKLEVLERRVASFTNGCDMRSAFGSFYEKLEDLREMLRLTA